MTLTFNKSHAIHNFMKYFSITFSFVFFVIATYLTIFYKKVAPILLDTSTGEPCYIEVCELVNNRCFFSDLDKILEEYNVSHFNIMGNIYFKGNMSDLANYTEHVIRGHVRHEYDETKKNMYAEIRKKYLKEF